MSTMIRTKGARVRNHCGYHFRELELADTPTLYIKDDGSLWLDQSAFGCPGMTVTEAATLMFDDLEEEYDKCNNSWYYILEVEEYQPEEYKYIR